MTWRDVILYGPGWLACALIPVNWWADRRFHAMTGVAPCSSKGRPGAVKVVKGGQYECVRCGRRWPMKQGSRHPQD